MNIGRLTFVAWLFIMAFSCFIIAGTNSSLGWFVGGIAILFVAICAKQQLKEEEEPNVKAFRLAFSVPQS